MVENDMCSHLDSVMPDNVQKILLHQDFWRHRRNCVRCSGRVKQSSFAWQNTVCPLEHLVKRPAPKKDNKAVPKVVPKVVPKAQTTPKKAVVKKEPSDEQQLAKGLVKVSYEIDDDFDAAEGTGITRTVWVQDFSQMDMHMKVQEMEEDDSIYEEIVISAAMK